MAKFKCKNCGHIFEKFCNSEFEAGNAKCPTCGSRWTELCDGQFDFPNPRFITPNKIIPAVRMDRTLSGDVLGSIGFITRI